MKVIECEQGSDEWLDARLALAGVSGVCGGAGDRR